MSTATLTSLAMLKVHVDQGRDYLDYLRPFILQVLFDHRPCPVTDAIVCGHIKDDFGLEIPERTVQIILKRLSRQQPMERRYGVYRITGEIQNPGISAQKAEADRHIQAVVGSLTEFSKNTARPIASDDDAVQAICAFLSKFNIQCLRAYLRGTAIPTIEKHDDALIVLVSKYVLSLQENNPERFESFLVVVKGHMLANALLCPDLQQAPKTYKDVTFYFDTPLLVRLLGLEGDAKRAAVENLIALLRKLGATVAVFSHSRDELERVIHGAAEHVDSPDSRSEIVMEAHRTRTTKSDLLLISGRIDEKLAAKGIKVTRTPQHIPNFQIDERAFEHVLDDVVSYHNPRAKEDDIKSVRSIYVLRKGTFPRNLERSKAVLVTSNSGFSRAAFDYGKDHEESRQVSSVITDFSLANMAWLKAPMGAPTIPMTEVMAFAYAALQPSKDLLNKYLGEIDKLQRQKTINERDHQLLRSSDLAQKELMNLTLGDEDALTEQTVTDTLSRITKEIKKEESEKYQTEQASHRRTLKELAAERASKKDVQERIFWRCSRRAKQFSWAVAAVVDLALVGGIVTGLGVTSSNPVVDWMLMSLFVMATIAGVVALLVDFSVWKTREKLEKWLLTRMIRREATSTGLDLE